MVATKDGRVVATHGDTKAEVNRGLNCVKGYFLSKILYGDDRLTRPLLRKKGGKYDKDGEFTPVSWDEAFDVMAQQFKAAGLEPAGPNDSYTQVVPLVRTQVPADASMSVTVRGERRPLLQQQDMAALALRPVETARRAQAQDSPLVGRRRELEELTKAFYGVKRSGRGRDRAPRSGGASPEASARATSWSPRASAMSSSTCCRTP